MRTENQGTIRWSHRWEPSVEPILLWIKRNLRCQFRCACEPVLAEGLAADNFVVVVDNTAAGAGTVVKGNNTVAEADSTVAAANTAPVEVAYSVCFHRNRS